MANSTQLIRRLRTVLSKWPEDPSRKGRDLGEHLAHSYKTRFEDESLADVRGVKLFLKTSDIRIPFRQ
jgi:hypothetical protein